MYLPFSFIKLGRTCTINNVKYRVIGRVRSQTASVREWDEEDLVYADEPGYMTDEWILRDLLGNIAYLSEYGNDEWPFVFSKAISAEGRDVPPTDRSHGVIEEGQSTVLFVEGENPDGEIVGESFFFKDFKERGRLYSCEWEMDEGMREGLWFFEDQELTPEQVMVAFDETDRKKRREKRASKKREYALWTILFTVAFWASAMLSFILFSMPLGMQAYTAMGRSYDPTYGIVFNDIRLDDKNATYHFVLKSTYGGDASNEVLFRLLDADSSILAETTDEHWQESGYDADGYWKEGHYQTGYTMRLDKAGTYRVQVVTNPPLPSTTYLQLTVYKNPLLLRYSLISTMLVGVGYAYFSLKRKSL